MWGDLRRDSRAQPGQQKWGLGELGADGIRLGRSPVPVRERPRHAVSTSDAHSTWLQDASPQAVVWSRALQTLLLRVGECPTAATQGRRRGDGAGSAWRLSEPPALLKYFTHIHDPTGNGDFGVNELLLGSSPVTQRSRRCPRGFVTGRSPSGL